MNFVKKSISAVLAGAVLISNIFIGTTAFAATPNYTAIGNTQAFSANVQLETNWVENKSNYYAFTAPSTGYYIAAVSTTPAYRDNNGNVVSTPTEDRFDYASVNVYEDAAQKKSVGYISNYNTYTSDYKLGADNELVPVESYYSDFETLKLIGGRTYYIEAYANAKGYGLGENNQIVWDTNSYATKATLSIAPADWNCECYEESVEKKYNVGNNVVTKYVYQPTAEVEYVGSAADVFVPNDVYGVPVKRVTGTENKMITSLTLSASVKRVYGFDNLKRLSRVNLNYGLEDMGSFSNDPALTSIVIPSTVKSIDDYSFYNDTALSSVAISNGVKSIGSRAFYNTALKSVVIPASVTDIGSYAFGFSEGLDANTVAPNDTTEVAVPGFAFAGTSGIAYEYAKAHGLAYYDMSRGCPHAYYVSASKAATLFKKGSTTSTCSLCGATSKKATKKKTFAIKSVKSTKKGKITVKAAKQTGISGYKIQYSTSKKFTKKTTKTVKVKTKKALSKSIKGLKSGKKYYVRVRAYKGKSNSAWTKVKAVKVK